MKLSSIAYVKPVYMQDYSTFTKSVMSFACVTFVAGTGITANGVSTIRISITVGKPKFTFVDV